MCHFAQLLVDMKWFDVVLLGYFEQLHSKNKVDQRFGGYHQKWRANVIISLEGTLIQNLMAAIVDCNRVCFNI